MRIVADIFCITLIVCLATFAPLLIGIPHDHEETEDHHENCSACVVTVSFQIELVDWTADNYAAPNITEFAPLACHEIFPRNHFQTSFPSRAPPS